MTPDEAREYAAQLTWRADALREQADQFDRDAKRALDRATPDTEQGVSK